MNEQLTLGVIGHVDHGKTALVRALTGIDTDRLQEEKERGLSIVLGFSHHEGKNGTIDFIDVPGHENFIRTMISGATGIDGALLVVAANEAIMPQTREHVAIAQLLGVDRGVIVVNKQDLVSDAQLERVVAEARSFLSGTFLETAEVVRVSAATGEGIDILRNTIEKVQPVENRASGIAFPFLPIDRAFVMPGFGPVVTGTLRGGELAVDGDFVLLPARRAVTIRGLQVHNRPVDTAVPGQRVAVNLRHINKGDIERGDVLTSRDRIETTRRIDVELELLDRHGLSLKNDATVRFLAGTSEMMARVRLLDCERLKPGATSFAQLNLSRELVAYPNQRFIIRSHTPTGTIGGGQVLDPHPERHRRFDARVTARLVTRARGSPLEKLRMILLETGLSGVTPGAMRSSLGVGDTEFDTALAELEPVITDGGRLIDRNVHAGFREAILVALGQYHAAHPNRAGVAAARLRGSLGTESDADSFDFVIGELVSEGCIEYRGVVLRLAGFDPLAGLAGHTLRLAANMEDAFRDRRLLPTYRDEIVGRSEVEQELFRLLCDTERLVMLKNHGRGSDFVVHAENFGEAVARIETQFRFPRKFTVAEVRELLGANRKFTVPFMEHLDSTGVTIRIGDLHQLRARYP